MRAPKSFSCWSLWRPPSMILPMAMRWNTANGLSCPTLSWFVQLVLALLCYLGLCFRTFAFLGINPETSDEHPLLWASLLVLALQLAHLWGTESVRSASLMAKVARCWHHLPFESQNPAISASLSLVCCMKVPSRLMMAKVPFHPAGLVWIHTSPSFIQWVCLAFLEAQEFCFSKCQFSSN